MATAAVRSMPSLLDLIVAHAPLALELAPLHTADQVAEVAAAIGKIPTGTPARAERIHKTLTFAERCTVSHIDQLVSRLESRAPRFIALASTAAAHASGETIILVPAVDSCVACGHSVLTDTRRGERARSKGKPNHPTVYSEGGMLRGELYIKTCASCGAAHTLSYAEGGTCIEAGKVLPYSDATSRSQRWYQSTRCTVHETSLLYRFETQALHSHTGWETFGEEWRDLTGADLVTDNFRKTLAHAWLSWSLLRWRRELELPTIAMKLTSDEGLDETLLDAVAGEDAAKKARDALATTRAASVDAAATAAASDTSSSLLYRFIDKWGRHHALHCRRPLPEQQWCMCYIIDGHMKCRRLVCENANARMVEMGEAGTAVLGCTGTPLPGGRFCKRCRPFCARRTPGPRPAGSQSTSTADFNALPPGAAAFAFANKPPPCGHAEVCVCPEEAVEAEVQTEAEAGAEAEPLQPGEENVHLVEALVDYRPLSKQNARPGHARCIKAGRAQYLVKWAGWPSDANSWECACDISGELIEPYLDAQAERAAASVEGPPAKRTRAAKKKHVGADAAKLASMVKGDFKIDDSEKKALKFKCGSPSHYRSLPSCHVAAPHKRYAPRAISRHAGVCAYRRCQTLKEEQYSEKKRTTAGGLFMVSACGLFIGVRELYGSESLTQVHLFLLELFAKHEVPLPTVLAYDDACHLLKFLKGAKRCSSRFTAWLLAKVKFVVDRFHWPNHKDEKFCALNVNPKKCAELGPSTNTEAAEESFAWLARSKHLFRTMNESRYIFVQLRLMELRNRFLVKRRPLKAAA